MFTPSDGLRRLLMAELVRQQFNGEGKRELAAQLTKVTNYHPKETERYPGTSSCWIEQTVEIYWENEAKEFQVCTWTGSMGELEAAIEKMVAEY